MFVTKLLSEKKSSRKNYRDGHIKKNPQQIIWSFTLLSNLKKKNIVPKNYSESFLKKRYCQYQGDCISTFQCIEGEAGFTGKALLKVP